MKLGQNVLVKYGMSLVKAIVIDIDFEYATLRVEYEKGKHCNIRVKNQDKELFSIDLDTKSVLDPKELYKESTGYTIYKA
jgi:hypothetical protein